MSKKVKRITKNTVIKSIKAEYLIPESWEGDIDKEGNDIGGSINKRHESNCVTCAVGAIIVNAKRSGKVKRFGYKLNCASTYNLQNLSEKELDEYLDTLISKGACLTALSDYFEMLCDVEGISGFSWSMALQWLNKGVNVRENKEIVKNNEIKMRKIKRKLIKFVEKKFPYYVELKAENKKKALKNTLFDNNGRRHKSMMGKVLHGYS